MLISGCRKLTLLKIYNQIWGNSLYTKNMLCTLKIITEGMKGSKVYYNYIILVGKLVHMFFVRMEAMK